MYYKTIVKQAKPANFTPYQLHQEIWSLFPGMQRGNSLFVYRIGNNCIYLISAVPPISTTGQWLVGPSKKFNPQIAEGTVVDFMTRVNPVYDRDGDRYGVVMDYIHGLRKSGLPPSEWPTGEELKILACTKWFKEKCPNFSIQDFRINQFQDVQFLNEKTGDMMKFAIADIVGHLVVTNPDGFKKNLFEGIGKSRRFGHGMVMVPV